LFRQIGAHSLFVIALGITKNTIGAAMLGAYWNDPDFDSTQGAFYWVRVTEISTLRRTAFDATSYDIRMPAEFPITPQQRTCTSRT
jgi:hypothetical protein